MKRNRLEAFSDGVLAIIITIMVLEMRVPHEDSFSALSPLLGIFLSYALSFIYLGIYWNNHHHLLHSVDKVTGPIMWANLHLLFWLSLIPFSTGWMGENHFAPAPTALYGAVLFMAGIAYTVLQQSIIVSQGKESTLGKAVARDWKGKVSTAGYAGAILIALKFHWIALGIYVLVAVLWLVPDRRAESALRESKS